MAGGGKGGKQEVVQRTEIDPRTQAYLDNLRRSSRSIAQPAIDAYAANPTSTRPPGPDALTRQGQGMYGGIGNQFGQAGGLYGQAGQGLQQGLGILGNAGRGDVSQFFNPYQQQVIDASANDFARQRQGAMAAAADQATKANAFGGSRGAVFQANALGDVNRDEASTLAGLRQSGFDQSFNRALQTGGTLANLGLSGAQGLLGAGQAGLGLSQQMQQSGEYNRALQERQQLDPYNRALQGLSILQGGIGMPGGSSLSQPTGSSPLQSAAGGALTGLSFGGPLGAAIGGGAGLLGGLFGW